MLKPYDELVKVDVSGYCDFREAKDDNGKKIQVPYLNWAKCVELLHEHGASEVWYKPLRSEDGSYLFKSLDVTREKDGRKTGCWFVAVEIHIDDLVFTMETPLMNGTLVVYEDTINQLRIANCHARAFVKGIAIRTGLGFSLWAKDADTDPASDDLTSHNIMAIKERIDRIITAKMQNGMELDDIVSALGLKDKQFNAIMGYFSTIYNFEKAVQKL